MSQDKQFDIEDLALALEHVRNQQSGAPNVKIVQSVPPAPVAPPSKEGWVLTSGQFYGAIGALVGLLTIGGILYAVGRAPLDKLNELDIKLTQIVSTMAKKEEVPSKEEFRTLQDKVNGHDTLLSSIPYMRKDRDREMDVIHDTEKKMQADVDEIKRNLPRPK